MKKGNNKIKNKWFLVASICFYISSIILYIGSSSKSMAVTNFCLGSCFLCLSVADTNNDKK